MWSTGTRVTMFTMMMLMALFLAGGSHAQVREPYFPELIFTPDDKDFNSLVDDMTSVHLRAMNEPSLWRLSQKDHTANTYRFLWLHPGKPQICLRLTRLPGSFVLHVAGHDGPPGVTAGRPTIGKDVRLTAQQGERIVGLLEASTFWAASVEVKVGRGIADGDGIVIEGVKNGKYHVIDRPGSVTGESYKAFCRSLLDLADEPDLLKAWDRFRQQERQSPRYRREPPQTEYRGGRGPKTEEP